MANKQAMFLMAGGLEADDDDVQPTTRARASSLRTFDLVDDDVRILDAARVRKIPTLAALMSEVHRQLTVTVTPGCADATLHFKNELELLASISALAGAPLSPGSPALRQVRLRDLRHLDRTHDAALFVRHNCIVLQIVPVRCILTPTAAVVLPQAATLGGAPAASASVSADTDAAPGGLDSLTASLVAALAAVPVPGPSVRGAAGREWMLGCCDAALMAAVAALRAAAHAAANRASQAGRDIVAHRGISGAAFVALRDAKKAASAVAARVTSACGALADAVEEAAGLAASASASATAAAAAAAAAASATAAEGVAAAVTPANATDHAGTAPQPQLPAPAAPAPAAATDAAVLHSAVPLLRVQTAVIALEPPPAAAAAAALPLSPRSAAPSAAAALNAASASHALLEDALGQLQELLTAITRAGESIEASSEQLGIELDANWNALLYYENAILAITVCCVLANAAQALFGLNLNNNAETSETVYVAEAVVTNVVPFLLGVGLLWYVRSLVY